MCFNFANDVMNCIISYYLTLSPDPQGRPQINRSDPNYVMKWYESIVKHGLNGVLFHDGIDEGFSKALPLLRTIQVPKTPDGMIFSDYHWIISHNYLRRHTEIENVFFTDCPDCEVINNPFIQQDYRLCDLYCGDEQEAIGESLWMRKALDNPGLINLPEYRSILTSDAPLYNGGVLGGYRTKVLEFTSLICELIERVKCRSNDGTGDMAIYNYILHRYFKPVHGFPVNSVFKGYEDRNDVWFKHK
jgi:hypothetical protein